MKLRGIVFPGGGGFGCGAQAWMATLSLQPWRKATGEIVNGRAVLFRECADHETLSRERSALPRSGEVVEVDVEQPELLPHVGRPMGADEFMLLAWRPVHDDELVAFAASVEPPPSVEDEVLGSLRFERELGWYKGTRIGPDGNYRLAIEPESPFEVGALLPQARAFVASFEGSLAATRDAIARELHDLWERSWRQDDEPPRSPAEFAAAFHVTSLTISNVGAEAWFDDGGLFGDHGVRVSYDVAGEVTRVGMGG